MNSINDVDGIALFSALVCVFAVNDQQSDIDLLTFTPLSEFQSFRSTRLISL